MDKLPFELRLSIIASLSKYQDLLNWCLLNRTCYRDFQSYRRHLIRKHELRLHVPSAPEISSFRAWVRARRSNDAYVWTAARSVFDEKPSDSTDAVIYTLLEYLDVQDIQAYLSSHMGQNTLSRTDYTWTRYVLRVWFRIDYYNWTMTATRNFAELFDLFEDQFNSWDQGGSEGGELLEDFRNDIGNRSFTIWIRKILEHDTVSERSKVDLGSTYQGTVDGDSSLWNVWWVWELYRAYPLEEMDAILVAEDAFQAIEKHGLRMNDDLYNGWAWSYYNRLEFFCGEGLIPEAQIYDYMETRLCSVLTCEDESSEEVRFWVREISQKFPAGYPDLECYEVSKRIAYIFEFATQKMPAA